jgi:hypothetical protein
MKDRRHSASEAGSFLMGQVNDIDVAKVADNLVPSPARSRAAAHGLRRITGRQPPRRITGARLRLEPSVRHRPAPKMLLG